MLTSSHTQSTVSGPVIAVRPALPIQHVAIGRSKHSAASSKVQIGQKISIFQVKLNIVTKTQHCSYPRIKSTSEFENGGTLVSLDPKIGGLQGDCDKL
jgi:hypothetical protein